MRLDELKEALSANVQDKREWLDKKADDIVAEMVSKEVPSRVNQQVNSAQHSRSLPRTLNSLAVDHTGLW